MMMSNAAPGRVIRILEDAPKLCEIVAEEFTRVAETVQRDQGVFRVALAGGSTPVALYHRLTDPVLAGRVDWRKVEVCFGDERCVPPTSTRSNFHMAKETLLDHLPIPEAGIHRIKGELNPHQAAREYQADLAALFHTSRTPQFDLILLGMGANGHVASLFPGSAALREVGCPTTAQYVETEREWRVTLTRPVLNIARRIWVLVSGVAKSAALREVLQGNWEPEVLPAQYLFDTEGEQTWWCDKDAAGLLEPDSDSSKHRLPLARLT